ncbi:MAG TPA: STAS-like domain-containing protein [Negativicutes bacterium]|nr:STAS-like domain-containing protein [Negativicutes bacterium]
MKKFGEVLTSRPAGREAYLSAKAYIVPKNGNETMILDFEGVKVLAPSWGDEFLTPLLNEYGNRLVIKNTNNLSVQATVETLEQTNGKTFVILQ